MRTVTPMSLPSLEFSHTKYFILTLYEQLAQHSTVKKKVRNSVKEKKQVLREKKPIKQPIKKMVPVNVIQKDTEKKEIEEKEKESDEGQDDFSTQFVDLINQLTEGTSSQIDL